MTPTPEQRKQQSAKNRAMRLEGCEARFKQGQPRALLDAVAVCGADQPLPEWAAEAFKEKYRAVVYRFEHASWDAVFGKPHPPGTKLGAQQQKHKLQFPVFERVWKLKGTTRKSYDEIFRQVADEFGISAANVKRYFEDVRNLFDWNWEKRPRISSNEDKIMNRT